MGFVDSILSALGMGQSDSQTKQRPEPVMMELHTKVPKEDNDIWDAFASLEIRLKSLTLHTTEGASESLSLAGGFDLREEEQVDGDPAVFKLKPDPAPYESGEFLMEVMEYELQENASDMPLDGFEEATIDFGGETFEPESGEEWILTLVLVATENDAGDAYVLDVSAEWELA